MGTFDDGIPTIEFSWTGSFQRAKFEQRAFKAARHGHAEAVVAAIAHLKGEVLPDALALDHRLAGEGMTPTKGFGRTYKEAYPEEEE